MRFLPLTALLALAPLPALADFDLTKALESKTISATLADLHGQSDPDADTLFAIGGLEFLSAVEATYRDAALYGDTVFAMSGFGGTHVSEIRPPRPYSAAAINTRLDETLAAMARARAALDAIPADASPAMVLDFDALWFDLDGDGQRSDMEYAADLLGPAMIGRWRWGQRPDDAALPVIRFDAADRHWLRAYTQLISGTSEMIRAFDPASAYTKITQASAAMRLDQFDKYDYYIGDGAWVDWAATLDMTLRHQPDPARTRAARDHWRGMIADNRLFWAALDAETDNDREFIPSDRQQSALGIDFPQGLGATWGAVLSDAESILTGEKSIPHWRGMFGISLADYLENPAPIDLAGWIHGWAALDYRSDAPRITPQSWDAFTMLARGEAGLMMLTLN